MIDMVLSIILIAKLLFVILACDLQVMQAQRDTGMQKESAVFTRVFKTVS
jgi:hypothetical protein